MEKWAYFLQEICGPFSFGAFEAHGFKELEDVVARALVDKMAFGDENDVVEKVVGFRFGLQE